MVISDDSTASTGSHQGLINSGHLASDILLEFLLGEVVETALLEEGLIKPTARRIGDSLATRAAQQTLKTSAQAGKNVGMQGAASSATNKVATGAAKQGGQTAAKTSAQLSTQGAKFATTASNAFMVATIAFSVVMAVLDFMDVNGYNIILDKKALEEVKEAYEEVFKDDLFISLGTRQDIELEPLLYDISPNGTLKQSDKWGKLYMEYMNEYIEDNLGFGKNWQDQIPQIDGPTTENIPDFAELIRYAHGSPEAKQKYITWGLSILAIFIVILIFVLFKYGKSTN